MDSRVSERTPMPGSDTGFPDFTVPFVAVFEKQKQAISQGKPVKRHQHIADKSGIASLFL